VHKNQVVAELGLDDARTDGHDRETGFDQNIDDQARGSLDGNGPTSGTGRERPLVLRRSRTPTRTGSPGHNRSIATGNSGPGRALGRAAPDRNRERSAGSEEDAVHDDHRAESLCKRPRARREGASRVFMLGGSLSSRSRTECRRVHAYCRRNAAPAHEHEAEQQRAHRGAHQRDLPGPAVRDVERRKQQRGGALRRPVAQALDKLFETVAAEQELFHGVAAQEPQQRSQCHRRPGGEFAQPAP
jgi:hypothetical protein